MDKQTINSIVLGVIVAGISYRLGKKNGFNECLYKCQQAVVNVIIDSDEIEEKEEA